MARENNFAQKSQNIRILAACVNVLISDLANSNINDTDDTP